MLEFLTKKVLYVFFSVGGMMLLICSFPYQSSGYQNYSGIRGSLAIPRNESSPGCWRSTCLSSEYGTGSRSVYDQNKIALISNVGNLIEPISREQFIDFSRGGKCTDIQVPPDLFSHSHQSEISQTNRAPQSGISHPGWGGLMADLTEFKRIVTQRFHRHLVWPEIIFGSQEYKPNHFL